MSARSSNEIKAYPPLPGHTVQDPYAAEPLLGNHASGGLQDEGRRRMSQWTIIPTWVSLSGALILYDRHYLSKHDFPFPIFLSVYQMLLTTIATRILHLTTNLLQEVKTAPINASVWRRTILPLSLCYTFSTTLSYSSSSAISPAIVNAMGSLTPLLAYGISLIMGLTQFNLITTVSLFIVLGGGILGGSTSTALPSLALIFQILAITFVASRIVLTEILVHGNKQKPLIAIYYYAPICAGLLSLAMPFSEGLAPIRVLSAIGLHKLVVNGLLAVGLEITGVYLIESTMGVGYAQTGVLRDIVLFAVTLGLGATGVSTAQYSGSVLAFLGLAIYKFQASDVFSPPRRLVLLATGGAVLGLTMLGISRMSGFSPSTSSSFGSSTSAANIDFLRSIRVPSPWDITTPMPPKEGSPQLSQFKGEKLLARELIPKFSPYPDPSTLPDLAWVMVMNPGQLNTYGEIVSSITCYCMRQNIPLYMDFVLSETNRHFFNARHYNIVKYLSRHQWVLFTDADILIANSTKNPRDFIQAAADGVDVIFSDRGGSEVCSCVYFIKNSPGGWSFLRRWMAWSDDEANPNWDNGDLNEIIMAGLEGDLPARKDGTGRLTKSDITSLNLSDEVMECINHPLQDWYVWHFRKCFQKRFRHRRVEYPWELWWDVDLFTWTPQETWDEYPPFRLRSYKEFGGFARNSPVSTSWKYKDLVDTDWLYHVHKNGEIVNASMSLCTGDDWFWQPVADMNHFREVFLPNYCPYMYPPCFDTTGKFICKEGVKLKTVEECYPA